MPAERTSANSRDPRATHAAQQAIGRKLRLALEAIVTQPLPEGWLALLRRKDPQDRAGG